MSTPEMLDEVVERGLDVDPYRTGWEKDLSKRIVCISVLIFSLSLRDNNKQKVVLVREIETIPVVNDRVNGDIAQRGLVGSLLVTVSCGCSDRAVGLQIWCFGALCHCEGLLFLFLTSHSFIHLSKDFLSLYDSPGTSFSHSGLRSSHQKQSHAVSFKVEASRIDSDIIAPTLHQISNLCPNRGLQNNLDKYLNSFCYFGLEIRYHDYPARLHYSSWRDRMVSQWSSHWHFRHPTHGEWGETCSSYRASHGWRRPTDSSEKAISYVS